MRYKTEMVWRGKIGFSRPKSGWQNCSWLLLEARLFRRCNSNNVSYYIWYIAIYYINEFLVLVSLMVKQYLQSQIDLGQIFLWSCPLFNKNFILLFLSQILFWQKLAVSRMTQWFTWALSSMPTGGLQATFLFLVHSEARAATPLDLPLCLSWQYNTIQSGSHCLNFEFHIVWQAIPHACPYL